MKDLWVQFGCFLTGYNYAIVKNSSEASAKAVKKFLSAILIISTLWCFIGFAFTQRYLHGGLYASLIGAFVMVVMVIQIERQIILSIGGNPWAYGFRVIIGILMAILGSVILDQIVFKDDVEKIQISKIQTEVNRLLPIKTQELTSQIQQLDISIQQKENERVNTTNEVGRNPIIFSPSTTIQFKKDSTGKMVPINKTVTNNSIANPKAELIPQINNQIKYLLEQKTKKENDKLNIQAILEQELKSKTGFLDELKILFSILLSSGVALAVWILLFLFFLAIELFVLVNKLGDSKNDYDKTIIHQMEMRIIMLEKLTSRK